MTGMVYLSASVALPTTEETKVEARTMSRVVTPKSLSLSACSWLFESDSLLGVKDTSLLEHLGEHGNGGVDGVGNDQNESLGAGVSNSLSKSCADAGVDLCHQLGPNDQ
jgi:hypothetical protein